jgi:GTPase
MRSGGAAVADLAVLVVSAQDGVCEQTGESIGCLDDLALPAVVALTKMDLVPEHQRAQVRVRYSAVTQPLLYRSLLLPEPAESAHPCAVTLFAEAVLCTLSASSSSDCSTVSACATICRSVTPLLSCALRSCIT